MYAIHLPRSSLFCEQAVYRQGEGSLVLWRKRTSSHEDGAGKREHELAIVAVRMERACVLSAAVRSSSLDRVQPDPATPVPPPWGLRKGTTLRIRAAGKRSDRQDSGASTGVHPSSGKFHATRDKAHGIPGSAPSVHPCKKIGRAASVGLGYCEKKRYRSPLVSL